MAMDLLVIWEDGTRSSHPGLQDEIAMSSGRSFNVLGAKLVLLVEPDGTVYSIDYENKATQRDDIDIADLPDEGEQSACVLSRLADLWKREGIGRIRL